ncbi:DUF885 domain-containing protein [Roseateles cellulosilyticus]|uniref:DUF885 domain-containing protein n=1 Tax=Pelomonas cellulosilytica TaxID=2906762 RepID=A0ABS8XPI8_9BURK|nr:DUF885 domain-containing protein [Pelomonas sp. P8]MCE4554666.1 DUF885 domain-containing protein [Pelomonas sp. P8]
MKLIRDGLAVLTLALGLLQPALAATPAERLADLATRAWDAQARFDPLLAMFNGDYRFNDQLALSLAPAERARRFDAYRGFLKELHGIPVADLSPSDRLTRELLERLLSDQLALSRFPDHLLPLEHMSSVPLLLAMFAGGQMESQPLRTRPEFEAYLKRLRVLPAWCDQAVLNLREGLARGIVQSPSVMEASLQQLTRLADPDLTRNPFGATLRLLEPGVTSGLAAQDAIDLARAFEQTLREQVVPGLQRLQAFAQADYMPAAARRTSPGLGSLPGGQDWYRQVVRDQTNTTLTPQAIHELGLREVGRIQQEIARLAPRLGFEGDPLRDGGLLAWLQADARWRPFKTEEDVLQGYRAINARVEPQLPRLFGRQPRTPLEIRAEPELTRATASPHYTLGKADGSLPGVFWAAIPDPLAASTPDMTALLLHEGQPGHHFQLALQQEMTLPSFRRHTGSNAYVEGWALYAETLGHELGLYDDPAAYAGQLNGEIVRAARLVVDTGLHAMGWPRERAIAYWMEITGANRALAVNQIDRYLAWPGQALGYKMGALRIQALRQHAEKTLGKKFRLAEFHDQVLGEGAMPVDVLDRRIRRWVAAQQR